MLKVYSASAGSGKTFRLAKEYILLLFGNRYAYRNILAVTFTNKATEEMKERILYSLYVLSSNPSSSPYYAYVAAIAGRENVAAQARMILESLMNDYGAFSVSTIDRFFQRTMRAFAKELGLYASYGVELDRKMIYSESIDDLIDSLGGEGTDRDLLEWLTDAAVASVKEKGKWNVKDLLKSSDADIFSEDFRILSRGEPFERLFPKSSVREVGRRCREITGSFRQEMGRIASVAAGIISGAGMEFSDFKGKSSSPFKCIFDIVAGKSLNVNPRLRKIIDSPVEDWIDPKSPFFSTVESIYANLNGVLKELLDYYDDNLVLYNSADIVAGRLMDLGVKADIAVSMDRILRERNAVMLDDTNQMLSEIISDSDAPFVYEKLGTRYEHYMLDEFQDTSRLQWRNFLPLVSNSLSQGNESLIVGDVKQSIYRWRSGDWRILGGELEEAFPDEIEVESLSVNWRSSENIVMFNNAFFTDAVRAAGDPMLSSVYRDVLQSVPDGKEDPKDGHVHVRFFDKGQNDEPDTYLAESVRKLAENGYGYSQIAVLVRSNKDGARAVSVLMAEGIPVVSNELLALGNSETVQYAVEVLRSTLSSGCCGKSLYSLCEETVSSVSSSQQMSESAYIHAFLDKVNEFVSVQGDDLYKFLVWWDLHSDKLYVSSSDTESAVSVMTIHKSKGLDFDAVVVPYFELELFKPAKKWVKLDEKDFGADLLACVGLTKGGGVGESLFSEELETEIRLQIVDSFNLAYVAFTRSVRELVIICKPFKASLGSKSKSTASTVSEYLYGFCKNACGEGLAFDFGEWTVNSSRKGGEGTSVVVTGLKSYPLSSRLRMSYDSSEYFSEDGFPEKLGRGKVLHEIMSRIVTPADTDASVAVALEQGDISSSQVELVRDEIAKALESVAEYRWFAPGQEMLNEVEIIEPHGNISRPDRVVISEGKAIVIDYKFGNPDPRYGRQVQRYMQLLENMGFADVKGYLWYVDDRHVEELKLKKGAGWTFGVMKSL